MWQLYAFLSLGLAALENVIDKYALAGHKPIDSAISTFWRSFVFFLGIVVIGYLTPPHHLTFLFHWGILVFAIGGVASSLFYTYLLQRVEVTDIGAASYLTPFVFLMIDVGIVHSNLSTTQIIGVLLLVLGGIASAVDGKSYKLKSEMTWSVLGIFLFNVAYTGGEAYLYKYLHLTYNLSGASFFASLWSVCALVLLLIVSLRGKLGQLWRRKVKAYIAQIAASKLCDSVSSILWASALSLVAVSQLSAVEAFFPLILFVISLVAQMHLKLKLKEDLQDKHHVIWKTGVVALLMFGGFLVR